MTLMAGEEALCGVVLRATGSLYEVLLGELTQYNPELLDKQRLLAVTKCDMLDEDLMHQMQPHLPEGIPTIFISSVTGLNIARLKDMLWEALQK